MSIRTFGLQTLASSASSVPWFGDTVQAAVGIPSTNQNIKITVNSITKYQAGDRIIVDPQKANQDIFLVQGFVGGSTLLCVSEGNAPTHTHSIGAIIELDIACSAVVLEMTTSSPNSAGTSIWLGSDNTVTSTGGGSAFYELYMNVDASGSALIPASFIYGQSTDANTLRTSDGWMVPSTNGLKISVSAIVI